ncbi:MAG: IclR family transcriptional regulator [Chloroflexi bacterium]|nr:IclR family transcriptional regulator [Chloroflexota bacterium]
MAVEQLRTLNRAVAVLDCFTQEHHELGVREIARMLNLSTSATGRLLASMREMGILSQDPKTRAYSLGARVLTWAGVYNASLDVRNKALPAIEELHQTTRETISLYVIDGLERVCVERLESPQTVRIVTRVGRRLPLYAGSAGKAIMAFLTPEQQEEVISRTRLEPLTPKTITDPAVLRRELKKVRERGCAVSYGEWIEDAAGVAAPIFDHNGRVIAALSISGPTSRFRKETVLDYCEEVKRVAAQISASLGYSSGSLVSTRSEEL